MKLALVSAILVVASLGSAAAAELRPVHSGDLCLDVKGGLGQPNGTPLIVFPCNNGTNQSFTIAGDGTIRAGERCVDVAGGNARQGDRVIIWPCHGRANQRWRLMANGQIAGQNGLCLDVAGFGGSGTGVVAWACKGRGEDSSNQRWILR